MNKIFKLSIILALFILTVFTAVTVSAASSGTCGTGVNWVLGDSGVLTISGNGDMKDFGSTSQIPWYSSRTKIKKIVICEGVSSIGTRAFYGCNKASEIILPESITLIGERAFYNCSSVAEIYLYDGLEEIPERAFYGCSSLESIIIPDTVEIIGDSAFQGCESLCEVVLSENLLAIGSNCFEECASLAEIAIPDSVEELGDDIFEGTCDEFKIIINYSSYAYEFFSETFYQLEVWCNINIMLDEDVIESRKIIMGESYTFPAKPDIEKEGYYFAGWSFEDEIYSAGKKITVQSDINAEAYFKMITFKVNFECMTGTNPTPAVKKYWEPLLLDFIPEKEGFEFKGWATSADSLEVAYLPGSSYETNRDIMLYAVWSEITYIVAYSIPETESVIPAQIKKHTEKLQLSDLLPKREGYTFTGWSTKEDAVLPEYKPGGLFDINEDTILYAVWKNGIIAGDADNNGVVEMTDLMIMIKRINNHKLTLTVDNIVAMDVYKDTYFNIKDLLKMAQFLSGWNNVVLGE